MRLWSALFSFFSRISNATDLWSASGDVFYALSNSCCEKVLENNHLLNFMIAGHAVLIIPPNFKGRIWFCFWSRKTISRAPHAHQILWAFLERAKQAIACDQSLRSRRLWFNDESRRLDAPHRAPDSKSTMQTQAQHTRTGSTSWRVILRIDQSKCNARAIPSTQSKVYLRWRVQQFLQFFIEK